jgi:hypothetical protein
MATKDKYTKQDICHYLSISQTTFENIQRKGKYFEKPEGRGNYDLRKCIADYIAYKSEALTSKNSAMDKAKLKKEEALAEMNAIQVAEKKGTMIKKSEAIEAVQKVLLVFKQRAQGMPTKLAGKLLGKKSKAVVKDILDKEVNELLTNLSKLETFVNEKKS